MLFLRPRHAACFVLFVACTVPEPEIARTSEPSGDEDPFGDTSGIDSSSNDDPTSDPGSGGTDRTTVEDTAGTDGPIEDDDDGGDATDDTENGEDWDTGGPVEAQVCPSFTDEFSGSSVDSRWYRSHPHRLEQIDGRLDYYVTAAAQDEFVRTMVTPETGTLAGTTTRYRPLQVPGEHGAQLTFIIQAAGNSEALLSIVNRNGTPEIEARVRISGELQSSLSVATYNSAEHMWLQIREDEGTLYFETSSNGVTFAEFVAIPTPFNLSNAQIGIAGHNWAPLLEDTVLSIQDFHIDCGGEVAS